MTPRTEFLLLITFYSVHAANLAWRFRTPWDVIWACHVSCLWIAAGVARRSGLLTAIGFCWLALGDCLWVLDLSSGGQLIPTSILTHVGGLWLGLRAIRRLGFPARAWMFAWLAMLGLVGVTRLTTPRAANVNLAFSVFTGWEKIFPTYPRYFVFLCFLRFFLTRSERSTAATPSSRTPAAQQNTAALPTPASAATSSRSD